MRGFVQTVGLVLVAVSRHQSSAQVDKATSYPPEIAKHLDLSVNPCDDFYKFSCGGWSRSVQIPSDSTTVWLYADEVKDKNRDVLLKMLKSNKPVVTKYFDSCMNTNRINQLGSTPLQKVLKQIENAKNVVELFKLAGELTLVNFNFLSAMVVGVDKNQATANVLDVKQASLPLPPAYYVLEDVALAFEPEYRDYISTVLKQAQLANSSEVEALVDTIVKLEKSIANIMTSSAGKSKHITFQEASKQYPLLFNAVASGMFAKAGVALPARSKPVVIRTPSYFDKLKDLLKNTHVDVLKPLMKYHYINAKNDLLSDVFTTAGFEISSEKLEGVRERPTREKFCVDYVAKLLPHRMGKEYAALKFDTESGNLAKDMITRVRAVMKQRLLTVDWLDTPTREAALQKLDKVTNLISHSYQVEELDGVTLNADDFFGNTDAILKWKNIQKLWKLEKRVIRGVKGEWSISGSEVNAYYEPAQNALAFPAGILQPPFFSKSYPAAINYGATGAGMGHELIHGFDNTGRLVDGDGNKVQWWTDNARAEFDKRKQCLVDQYSKLEVVSNYDSSVVLDKVNGKTTLNENIADVFGFSMAFEAYQKFIEQTEPQHEEPAPEMYIHVNSQRHLNDVSSSKTELEKLFYVAFAQSLCAVKSEGLEDGGWKKHAPPSARVTGTIMNNRYFGQLFNCPTGTKMNPKVKCSLW